MSHPGPKVIDPNADLKERVRAFWQAHPCGTKFSDAEMGTREFFQRVEAHRYATEWHIPEHPILGRMEGECRDWLWLDRRRAVRRSRRGFPGIDLTEAAIDLVPQAFQLFDLGP